MTREKTRVAVEVTGGRQEVSKETSSDTLEKEKITLIEFEGYDALLFRSLTQKMK